MPGRQMLRRVMPGWQVLRMKVFQSLRVWTDERRVVAPWWRRRMSGLARMMRISLLNMGQWSDDDGDF